MALVAEGDELTEIQRVGVAGEAPVAAEEPGERYMFRIGKFRVVDDNRSRGVVVMGYLPSRWDSGDEATGPQMDEITTVFLARWPVPEWVRSPALAISAADEVLDALTVSVLAPVAVSGTRHQWGAHRWSDLEQLVGSGKPELHLIELPASDWPIDDPNEQVG